jgi:hypothetical protein
MMALSFKKPSLYSVFIIAAVSDVCIIIKIFMTELDCVLKLCMIASAMIMLI